MKEQNPNQRVSVETQARLKRLEKAANLAPELEKLIQRATSWDQLFASPFEEEQDYLDKVVGNVILEYSSNDTLKNRYSQLTDDGLLFIFERTMEGYTTSIIKHNSDRNVVMTFEKPNEEAHVATITYDVGNINHEYTSDDLITLPQSVLSKIVSNSILYQEIVEKVGTSVDVISLYLDGNPASKGWEDIMLRNAYFPQRIGHRIYPNFALEANKKLKQEFPNLFK